MVPLDSRRVIVSPGVGLPSGTAVCSVRPPLPVLTRLNEAFEKRAGPET